MNNDDEGGGEDGDEGYCGCGDQVLVTDLMDIFNYRVAFTTQRLIKSIDEQS